MSVPHKIFFLIFCRNPHINKKKLTFCKIFSFLFLCILHRPVVEFDAVVDVRTMRVAFYGRYSSCSSWQTRKPDWVWWLFPAKQNQPSDPNRRSHPLIVKTILSPRVRPRSFPRSPTIFTSLRPHPLIFSQSSCLKYQ